MEVIIKRIKVREKEFTILERWKKYDMVLKMIKEKENQLVILKAWNIYKGGYINDKR